MQRRENSNNVPDIENRPKNETNLEVGKIKLL